MVIKSRGYVQGLEFIEVFIRQAVLIMNSRGYGLSGKKSMFSRAYENSNEFKGL